LLGEVKNIHLGFSRSITSVICSTFRLKFAFLGTAGKHKIAGGYAHIMQTEKKSRQRTEGCLGTTYWL
jgi:hypothetical protein